jgi:AraC-like DNA-binding protein
MAIKKNIADGQDYFTMGGFPITVLRTQTSENRTPSHPHDLTEVAHSHDFCEMVIITGGSGIHWLHGYEFPVAAGDVFLLQGNQRHYFHDRKHLEMINVMYDPNQLRLPESELLRMPGYGAMFLFEPTSRRRHRFASRLHLTRSQLAQIEPLIATMEEEIKDHKPGGEAILLSHLIRLIVYLSRAYTGSSTIEAASLLRIGNVISAIEHGYARHWTLSDILSIAHMSRSTLMRVFRKATGQTPIEYLVRLRIQKAMELLRHTDWTITRIALEAGFNDSNYFTRQFRRANNQSPSQYRRT